MEKKLKDSIQNKPAIHLICNAHLDPVWLWDWEDGIAEAISTFRTAVEICEQNDTFIFNHNEAILYKWVQEYSPDLFKRIQKLVKDGKWHIMGGWYLQPDCNMPSGESFVRQILLGKRYFKDFFNVEPNTAINFDSFGHTRGLVQILSKCNYDSYLFGRPEPAFCQLEGEKFIWIGYDGSEILAHRFEMPYHSFLGKAREKIEKWLSSHHDITEATILWGVGNHGGGPSRKDIADINQLIKDESKFNITHSTPERFFEGIKNNANGYPCHKKDINPWAVGCYSSMSNIKKKHRQLENSLFMLEKLSSMLAAQGFMEYPHKEFEQVFEDLATIQFHDILTGTSTSSVEESSLIIADHGLEILRRLKCKIIFTFAKGEPKQEKGTIPIFVINPHPFKINQIIECEFNLEDINWQETFFDIEVFNNERKKVMSQVEKEEANAPFEWRKKVAFMAELKPFQMNKFICKPKLLKRKPQYSIEYKPEEFVLVTKDIKVVINRQTGLIDEYCVKGVSYFKQSTFEHLVMLDNEDPWAHYETSFTEVEGKFSLMQKDDKAEFAGIKNITSESVKIIENGSLRFVIEVLFNYEHSVISQYYKIPKIGTEIEIETKVYWNEKSKMLKLAIPLKMDVSKFLGQVAYGFENLNMNDNEQIAQKWVAAVDSKKKNALTVINDSTYSCSFSDDSIRLTLLRSPAYAAWSHEGSPIISPDRYVPRTDQGERTFKFWINAGNSEELLERIDRESLVKNEKPFAFSFFTDGDSMPPRPIAVLNDKVIQITSIKFSEANDGIIIRLFEPTGKRRRTCLQLPFLEREIELEFEKFEIKTLHVDIESGRICETNLLESFQEESNHNHQKPIKFSKFTR